MTPTSRRKTTDAYPLPQLLAGTESGSSNNAGTKRSPRKKRASQSTSTSTKNAPDPDAKNIVDGEPADTSATPIADAVATSETTEVGGSQGNKGDGKTIDDLQVMTQGDTTGSETANHVNVPPATDDGTKESASQGKAASKATAAATAGGGAAAAAGAASGKTPSKKDVGPHSSKIMVTPESRNQVKPDAQAVVHEGVNDGILTIYNIPYARLINFAVFIRTNVKNGIPNSLRVNQTDINMEKVRNLQGTLCGGDHKNLKEDGMNSATMAMFLTEMVDKAVQALNDTDVSN